MALPRDDASRGDERDSVSVAAEPRGTRARFELAPPRHFLLPAVLLLLSERPDHGYNLVKSLRELRFGRVDRPSVYRALAQLERDGLIESWSAAPKAGQSRRMYRLNADGERVLRVWMGIIREERDGLDRVLRRYASTGSVNAIVEEVGPGANGSAAAAWNDLVMSARPDRPARATGPSVERAQRDDRPVVVEAFDLKPDRSAVMVLARSTVGPIAFGTIGVTGWVEVAMRGLDVLPETRCRARLALDVAGLRSGNSLYDAELLRRIDARRFPTIELELRESSAVATTGRYRVAGDATFHGVTRPLIGTVTVAVPDGETLMVTGEQSIDIRDFCVTSPAVLMLRIYPDVMVQLHLEARRCEPGTVTAEGT